MHTAQADAALTVLMALLAMAYASAAGLYMRSQAVRRWLRVLALPLPHIGIMPILIVAALLRLPLMFTSFWYDETFSAGMIAMPFDQMLRATMADVHPPLPYSVLWIWSQVFGQSELALRLPSLLLGVLAVYLIWRVAMAMITVRVATMAAVLAALMPAMIYYSSEARGYMLLTVLVLIAVLGIIERRPVLMLAAGLLPWVHAHGYLYMAALLGVALLWRRWMLWPLIAGVLGALWLPGIAVQAADVADGFWLTNRHYAGWLAWSINMSFGPPQTAFTISFAIVGWIVATVAAVGAIWQRQTARLIWPTLVIVVVPAITVIISVVWRPVLLDRALLPVMALAIPLWAAGMDRWPVARGVVLICAGVVGLGMLTPDAQRYDNRAYYQFCDGADYVYVTSTATAITARYYFDGPIYTYTASNDLNQQLPPDVLRLFDMTPQSWEQLPAGDACVVEYQNNYVRPDQIIEARKATVYPHRVHTAIDRQTPDRIELLRLYRVYR